MVLILVSMERGDHSYAVIANIRVYNVYYRKSRGGLPQSPLRTLGVIGMPFHEPNATNRYTVGSKAIEKLLATKDYYSNYVTWELRIATKKKVTNCFGSCFFPLFRKRAKFESFNIDAIFKFLLGYPKLR